MTWGTARPFPRPDHGNFPSELTEDKSMATATAETAEKLIRVRLVQETFHGLATHPAGTVLEVNAKVAASLFSTRSAVYADGRRTPTPEELDREYRKLHGMLAPADHIAMQIEAALDKEK